LEERVYAGREAELRESIDRQRLRVVHAGEAERGVVLRALEELRLKVAALDRAKREESIEIDTECEPKEAEAAEVAS
jgi:hypothetical protein